MLRRRQILYDDKGTTALGNYLPTGATSVVNVSDPVDAVRIVRTVGQNIPAPSLAQKVVGTAQDALARPINVIRSITPQQIVGSVLPSLTTERIPIQVPPSGVMQRLAATTPAAPSSLPADLRPAPLDRMKMIGTEIIKKGNQPLLPNTPVERATDKLGQIAEQVKGYLSSKLPSISTSEILGILKKLKVPALVALGIAAVAALVFAAYSIYKRVVRVENTGTPAPTATPALPMVALPAVPPALSNTETPPVKPPLPALTQGTATTVQVAEPVVVYHSDIIDIVKGLGDRYGLSGDQRTSLITRIRNIAESTNDASVFVAKVADIENQMKPR